MNDQKKLLFLYDFTIHNANRGCQALAYGSVSFLKQIIEDIDGFELVAPSYCFRKKNDEIHNVEIDDITVQVKRRYYFLPGIIVSALIYKVFKGLFAVGRFSKDLKRLEYVANISGGDGFSDIYSPKTFFIRLWPSILAVFLKKKLIILPQTIGPFYNKYVGMIARYVIKGASKVYVRDLSYAKEIEKLGVSFTQTCDVSSFMKPRKMNYPVKEHSVGINVSGLTYYNNYRNLAGKFANYKDLISNIIGRFQEKNIPVYLVPHSYNFNKPGINSDDLQASKDLYANLKNKEGVYVIDLDMTAPELKYIISRFDFFIATRMHAGFDAIYTKTPVYALAYSYKFSGSFDLYGLNSNYSSVINMSKAEAEQIARKVLERYDQRADTKIIL